MKFAFSLPKLSFSSAKAPKPKAAEPDLDEKPSRFAILSDRKRMLRIAALLLVAGAAGQVMQANNIRTDALRLAANAAQRPAIAAKDIVPLSGEVTPKVAKVEASLVVAAAEPQMPMLETKPIISPVPEPEIALAAATPEAAAPPLAEIAPTAAAPISRACDVIFDLATTPGAMIGITLIAPCAPNSRVVLKHAGLAITGLTSTTGALFTVLPALSTQAKITATLADGTKVDAQIEVPEAIAFRRFGIQWQGDDAFQVHAFESGAVFGGPGHIFGVQPGQVSDAGGFLQILGDPAAPMPLLAEIYTYPAARMAVEMVVESAVTDKTCGRELLGETVASEGGRVIVTDLTLAMPDCSAVGDFLVLNNLAVDMTLAAN